MEYTLPGAPDRTPRVVAPHRDSAGDQGEFRGEDVTRQLLAMVLSEGRLARGDGSESYELKARSGSRRRSDEYRPDYGIAGTALVLQPEPKLPTLHVERIPEPDDRRAGDDAPGRLPLYVSSARRKEVVACWTRRLHVSVSKNSRFAFRKPLHVSAGESACASSPTATLHSFLTEKRCILFPSTAHASRDHYMR